MTREEVRKIARRLKWDRATNEDSVAYAVENMHIFYLWEAYIGRKHLGIKYVIEAFHPETRERVCFYLIVLYRHARYSKEEEIVLQREYNSFQEAKSAAEDHYLDFVASLLK